MTARTFATRAELRAWLADNCLSHEGIWILFQKKNSGVLTAAEALEEALCFGWIDGQIRRVDDAAYAKYFKQRAPDSAWSEKNKTLCAALEQSGQMTDHGRAKIAYAKEHGAWDAPLRPVLTDEQLADFGEMIRSHAAAYENYCAMTPSIRRAYASSYYFGAKTEEGKKKRLAAVIERLRLNLDPMESMKGKKPR